MKRLILLLLTAVMVFSCFACQGGKKTPQQSTDQSGMGNPALSYDKSKYTELFSSPTTEYRWHAILHDLSGILDKNGASGFTTHIQTWKANGQGGVVGQITPNREYLDSPTAFSDFNKVTKLIFNKGLNMWLYDEVGYPSGSAGGRTTLNHPEYVAKGLVCIQKTGSGTSKATVNKDTELLKIYHAYAVDSKGNIHKATVNSSSASFEGVSGNWTLYVFAEKTLYEGTHAENNGSQGNNWIQRDYINIMDKNAVAAFINNTYKAYADKYTYFDQVVGIFTDEPSLMEKYQNTSGQTFKYAQLSWVDGFDTEFEKMHGYSILDNLHHMFGGDSDEAKIVRTNYRQTVAELVSKNYFGQIAQFCRDNGTALSGHGLLEESIYDHVLYYGDYMQAIREMDIPGIDSLWGNPETYLNYGVFMSAKYATSTGTLMGKDRLSMVELCAVDIDNDGKVTDDEKKQVWTTLNLMYFNGLTHINSYFAAEYFGNDIRDYTDYFARLAYISRNAKWDSDVGLYYPVNTQQAYSIPSYSESVNKAPNISAINSIAREIFKNQLDFTVVDNEFILEAKVENGRLYNDHVSFKAICMPAVEVIPLNVLKKLNEFEQSGGTVQWVGRAPSLPDSKNDIAEFKELASKIVPASESDAIAKIKAATVGKLKVTGATSTLYMGKYIFDGQPMYWLFNYNGVTKTIPLSYEGAKGFDVYDPATGNVTSYDGGSVTVKIDGNNTMFVVVRT